jgi:hypothetical protein
MSTRSILRCALLLVLLASTSVHAQGTLFRAYLASDGNDANPCTLVSPCRLLPAALAAVLSGGEVWMLDSANYNTATVTIGKSVSILAVPGAVGSIVATSGPAISIVGDFLIIALRNLVIVPLVGGSGTHGVHMTGNSSLTIENSLIANHFNDGVQVSGTGRVKITDSILRNNGGRAVLIEDGATADIIATRIFGNGGAVWVRTTTASASATANVSDCAIQEGYISMYARSEATGSLARLFITRSTIHATYFALTSSTTGVGTATIAISNTMVVNNTYAWYIDGAGATIRAFGNNPMSDNSSAFGALTSTPLL